MLWLFCINTVFINLSLDLVRMMFKEEFGKMNI